MPDIVINAVISLLSCCDNFINHPIEDIEEDCHVKLPISPGS